MYAKREKEKKRFECFKWASRKKAGERRETMAKLICIQSTKTTPKTVNSKAVKPRQATTTTSKSKANRNTEIEDGKQHLCQHSKNEKVLSISLIQSNKTNCESKFESAGSDAMNNFESFRHQSLMLCLLKDFVRPQGMWSASGWTNQGKCQHNHIGESCFGMKHRNVEVAGEIQVQVYFHPIPERSSFKKFPTSFDESEMEENRNSYKEFWDE